MDATDREHAIATGGSHRSGSDTHRTLRYARTTTAECGVEESADKAVELLSGSGGGSPAAVLERYRGIDQVLNTRVLPDETAIQSAIGASENGRLTDENRAGRGDTLGTELVDCAGSSSWYETNGACTVRVSS